MWTEERYERVRRLWESREHSASAIAKEFETTRSAIIGLARRNRWEGGTQPGRTSQGGRKRLNDHDMILNMWERGQTWREIAAVAGITPANVNRIVCEARYKGDPRAVYHGTNAGKVLAKKATRIVKGVGVRRFGDGVGTYVRKIKSQDAPVVRGAVAMPEPVSRDLSILDLKAGQCKWAHGDGPFLFCGAQTEGRSYCPHHHARTVQPEWRTKAMRRRDSRMRVFPA